MTPIWMNLYAPVTGVRVAAQGARGWTYDASGNIFYYDDINYLWVQIAPPSTSSPVISLSASSDGSLLAVCADGNCYMYDSGSWSQVYPTSNATINASIGDINNFAVVDNTGAVIRSSYTINTALTSGPVKVSGIVGMGQIWGVGATGTVYKYNSSTSNWDTVPGKNLASIHVSLSATNTLQVFGVDANGKGWSYDTSTSAWQAIVVPNPGDKYAWLEGGAGYIWGALQNGNVYRGFL